MQVDIKRVNWVSPAGLLGVSPLASLGDVRVGPSALEGSSLEIPDLRIKLDPLQSLLQGHPVLDIHADQAQVGLLSRKSCQDTLSRRQLEDLLIAG